MTASVQPESHSRPSRRALLAGVLGGIGAWAAGAIDRAHPASAVGETMVVGGTYSAATSLTSLTNSVNDNAVFSATNLSAGDGLEGSSGDAAAVRGSTFSGFGLIGTANIGVGVRGESSHGNAVEGETFADSIGVVGLASATSGSAAFGVFARSDSVDAAAIGARSAANKTAVLAKSGGGSFPTPKAKTAVYGYAGQDSNSKGLWGNSPAGHGIHGESSSGWAGYFDGRVLVNKYMELKEIGNPSAPGSNYAKLFIRDNGSGKTQLCVRFHTGSIKVLATQS